MGLRSGRQCRPIQNPHPIVFEPLLCSFWGVLGVIVLFQSQFLLIHLMTLHSPVGRLSPPYPCHKTPQSWEDHDPGSPHRGMHASSPLSCTDTVGECWVVRGAPGLFQTHCLPSDAKPINWSWSHQTIACGDKLHQLMEIIWGELSRVTTNTLGKSTSNLRVKFRDSRVVDAEREHWKTN